VRSFEVPSMSTLPRSQTDILPKSPRSSAVAVRGELRHGQGCNGPTIRWRHVFALMVVVAILTPIATLAVYDHPPASYPPQSLSPSALSPPIILASTERGFDAATGSTQAGLAVTPGDFILVFVSAHYKITVLSVRDSSGDSYALLTTVESGSQATLSIWSAVSGTSSASLLVTADLSRVTPTLLTAVVVTGTGTPPIDVVGPGATSSDSNSVSTSITPLHAPDLLLLGVASTGGPTLTPGTGMTAVDQLTETAGSVNQMGGTLSATSSSTTLTTLATRLSTVESWAAAGVAVESLQGPPPTTYPVKGTVLNPNDQTIGGATLIAIDGGTKVETSSSHNGSFFLSLHNGSYLLSAGSPGYLNDSLNLTVRGSPVSGVNLTLPWASGPPLPGNGTIQHVVVIMMENQPLSTVLRTGPYERYLDARYGNATRFYSACHPSVPNYLAATSGDPFQCGTDAYRVHTTTNLPDLLQARNLTWAGYFENMTGPCSLSNNVTYVEHHNPFLYYADVIDNASRCRAHDLPATSWKQQVGSGTLLNYSFYVPNNRNDAENTSVPFADAWLKGFLSPLLNSTSTPLKQTIAHTAFFILYDESKLSDGSGYNGTNGGHVYGVVVSPYSRGVTFTNDTTDYNLLSTIEWLFGLGVTGHYDGTSKFPAMKAIFNFSL